MKLAVVIPAYEKVADVLTCVNSLRYYADGDVDIHVQDDASPSVDFRAVVPPCAASVERNEVNGGFAVNANAGIRAAIRRYAPDVVVLTNQDISAVEGWSQGWNTALLNAFAGEQVGIVAPRLLFPDGAVQSAGGTWDALAQPVHRCFGWSNPNAEDCATAQDVPWATGAVLAIQVSLFDHLHGFDERYVRGYWEDVDLCMRAVDVGARIRYEPACTLVHRVGSTGGSAHFLQNALRFKQQWVDSGKVKPGTLRPVRRYW